MYSKTIFMAAFAAIASIASAASPPACLLGAVNQYEKPADIAAVCKAKDTTSKISKVCGDAAKDALAAFADICNTAGVKVSSDVSATATGTATGTRTGTLRPSGTGFAHYSGNSTISATGTGNLTLATATPTAPGGASGAGGAGGAGGASGTATGGPAESTGAAGKLELSAAALLAGLGLMAAAL